MAACSPLMARSAVTMCLQLKQLTGKVIKWRTTKIMQWKFVSYFFYFGGVWIEQAISKCSVL
jgi:hypothetical protein